MGIDTIIKVHLSNGKVVKDECNYKALLLCINEASEFLISNKNIIPKINIEFIETIKIEGGSNE